MLELMIVVVVSSAVCMTEHCCHQFGFQNHCQRHLVLKTRYGCLLVIGLDARTAVWSILCPWGSVLAVSLVVSSAVCLTRLCHTNLDSIITARDIWCLKLGMVVCW
jgi:hypothetical protein